jgi:hypothetical protein
VAGGVFLGAGVGDMLQRYNVIGQVNYPAGFDLVTVLSALLMGIIGGAVALTATKRASRPR